MAHWLVTWEAAGGRAAAEVEEPIAAIFNGRWGSRRVAEIVELLYASRSYSPIDWYQWARTGKNPYPAQFGITTDGHPWDGEITCGHNPHLYARLVDDLRFDETAGQRPTARWKERERPKSHLRPR